MFSIFKLPQNHRAFLVDIINNIWMQTIKVTLENFT